MILMDFFAFVSFLKLKAPVERLKAHWTAKRVWISQFDGFSDCVCVTGCDGAFWTCLCRTLWVWWDALWSGHWTVSLSTRKDRKTLWERYTHLTHLTLTLTNLASNFQTFIFFLSLCSRSYGLSNVSVHTEASVTSAQVTAHVPSPGWDPPVRKVRVCMCVG